MIPASAVNKERKCLSFETKFLIIEEMEKGKKPKADICRDNSIASSTLSTFLKDKEKVKAAVMKGTNNHKYQRTSTSANVFSFASNRLEAMMVPYLGVS